MPTTPWVYLSSRGPGTGQHARTSAASKPSNSVAGRSNPMSMSSTRPHSARPWTPLSPPKVTVSVARTAGPSTAPVCTSIPLGTSTATTAMPACSTASNTAAAGGRSSPLPEIPTTPSITRSVASGRVATTRPPADRNAASAPGCVRSGLSRIAVAATPRRRSRAAAHRASPPLFPEPTTAQICRPATAPVRRRNSAAIALAKPVAARRISAPSGSPASSGASATRICSAV